MGRAKLTAKHVEERKERERLRSQQRRQAAVEKRQTELFTEAAQTPTVRIIETKVTNPIRPSNTITNLNLRSQAAREDNNNSNGFESSTNNSVQLINNRETATLNVSGQPKHNQVNSQPGDGTDQAPSQVKDCTVNCSPASSLSHPLASESESAQRYNFRIRKSPTPTNYSLDSRPSSSAAGRGARPERVDLPLRSIGNGTQPRHAPSRVQSGDEQLHAELESCQVPASPDASNASARRVQQCRARQRAQRREQHIMDANQRRGQVRVVTLPNDVLPPAASVPRIQPEPEPEQDRDIADGDTGDRNSTVGDGNFEETLVQSTIVVASDQVPSPSCQQAGNVDDDQQDGGPAEQAAGSGGILRSLEQEQSLFVSDDDTGLPGGYGSVTPSSDVVSEGTAPPRQRNHLPERPTHSLSLLPLLSPTRSCLEEAVTAIASSESQAGLEFIARQGIAYRRIFREALSLTCGCK